MALSVTSPSQLQKRINEAFQYEDEGGVPSLPSILEPDLSDSDASFNPGTPHPTPFKQPSPVPDEHRTKPSNTPGLPVHLNSNARSTSHLTSTPASIPQRTRRQFDTLRENGEIQSAGVYGVKSPEASLIAQNKVAQSQRENMVIMSTSSSENEVPQRKPKTSSSSSSGSTTRLDDFRSPRSRFSGEHIDHSDESDSFASKKSPSAPDLSELGDLMPGHEFGNTRQSSAPLATHAKKVSAEPPPKSFPSLAHFKKSSLQSTPVADSPEPDTLPPPATREAHMDKLHPSRELKLSGSSNLTSPGVGRRDSPRQDASYSYSVEDFSRDSPSSQPKNDDLNDSSHEMSLTPPQREKITTPVRYHQAPGDQAAIQQSRRQTLLLSTLKAAQPATALRSAKRTHVLRRLTEAADDTSDLSAAAPHVAHVNSLPEADLTLEGESDSTAHDLTTHGPGRHANGINSFTDGDGDRSARFNGGKLNSYIHSLNTQLTMENQHLCESLATAKDLITRLETENQQLIQHKQEEAEMSRSGGKEEGQGQGSENEKVPELEGELHRLQQVVEDQNAEIRRLRQPSRLEKPQNHLLQQISNLKEELSIVNAKLNYKDQETANLHSNKGRSPPDHEQAELISDLQDELADVKAKLAGAENDLQEAQAMRQREKEAWATKIDSIKAGVGTYMTEADVKLAAAIVEIEELKDLANSRFEELNSWKDKFDRTVTEYEDRLEHLKHENQELETSLRERDSNNSSLGRSSERRLVLLQKQVTDLQNTVAEHEKTLFDTKFNAKRAAEQHGSEIQRLHKRIGELQFTLDQATQDVCSAKSDVHQLEDALHESDRISREQQTELLKLKSELDLSHTRCTSHVSAIEELEGRLSKALEASYAKSSPLGGSSTTPHRKIFQSAFPKHRAHEELAQAYEEIDRLRARLATPGEKADSEILNLKIKSLETHRAELEERVKMLRQQACVLVSTPGKSPAGHSHLFKSIASLRTPKSPNRMLANTTSFANDASLSAEETIAPMLTHIQELETQVITLREQLSKANQSIDEKISKLSRASQDSVGYARELSESKGKIKELEEQLEKLVGARGTINLVKERLADVKCPLCGDTFDANQVVRFRVLPELNAMELSLPSGDESVTGETENHHVVNSRLADINNRNMEKIAQQLRTDLDNKNQQVEELLSKQESESQMSAQLREALAQAQVELNAIVQSLEEEKVRHRRAEAERSSLLQEKKGVEERLRETEAKLTKTMQARDCTEAELRALQNQKAQTDGLSKQLSKAQLTIDSLMDEKVNLLQNIEDLNHQIDHQRDSIRTSKKANVELQKSVQEQHEELTNLRESLEMKSAEIDRLRDIKDDVLNQAENMREDLLQVRTEAEDLAHDLHLFKQKRSNNNELSAKASASAKELVRLRDELLGKKKQVAKLTEERQNHVCNVEPRTLSAADLKKHSTESKGLLLRIRFLKLLFTRESTFRADLATQKRMLLTKLGQTELRNEAIQLALENFGLPSNVGQAGNFTIASGDISFKGVAMAVRAVCKIKILSKKWKEEERVKQKLKEAYFKVRGKEFEA